MKIGTTALGTRLEVVAVKHARRTPFPNLHVGQPRTQRIAMCSTFWLRHTVEKRIVSHDGWWNSRWCTSLDLDQRSRRPFRLPRPVLRQKGRWVTPSQRDSLSNHVHETMSRAHPSKGRLPSHAVLAGGSLLFLLARVPLCCWFESNRTKRPRFQSTSAFVARIVLLSGFG